MTHTYHRQKPAPRRIIAGAILVVVFAVLLLAPLAAALAESDPLPRAEYVGADGARQVLVPQTQPADAVPRLELFDADNSRRVFILPVAPPETQPTSGIVDGIPYPARPSFTAAPGTDLAKLTQDAALTSGTYTASGDIKRTVVGTPGTVPVLKLKTGQTIHLSPDVFAGVVVDGGGLSKDANGKPGNDDLSKAGTFAGKLVHSCTFQNAEGFGLLTNDAQVRVTQCVIAFNGSGGIGGTGSGSVLVDNCEVHDNNVKYGRTNSNKWTRKYVVVRDCSFRNNSGRDIWTDNYAKFLGVYRCRFRGTVTDRSGDRWKAGNIAAELTDKLEVKDCDFLNDVGGCIYVNEVMFGTLITGNTFNGKSDRSIELRDLARGNPFHTLRGPILITGNTFLSKTQLIAPSGAGNKVGMKKNGITVTGNVGSNVKIPS